MSPGFNLSFDHEFQYRDVPGLEGVYPAITVGLIGPAGAEDLLAIIDTGARYCLFDGRRARSIGLDLMSGRQISLSGLAGSLPARLHEVTLEIFDSQFPCEVAFSELPIRRELLGRHALFRLTRFGFREGISLGYFHPQP